MDAVLKERRVRVRMSRTVNRARPFLVAVALTAAVAATTTAATPPEAACASSGTTNVGSAAAIDRGAPPPQADEAADEATVVVVEPTCAAPRRHPRCRERHGPLPHRTAATSSAGPAVTLVTTPTAEAVGFSGRLHGLTGQPGPQDVDRRVHVGVCGAPAGRADERGLCPARRRAGFA